MRFVGQVTRRKECGTGGTGFYGEFALAALVRKPTPRRAKIMADRNTQVFRGYFVACRLDVISGTNTINRIKISHDFAHLRKTV